MTRIAHLFAPVWLLAFGCVLEMDEADEIGSQEWEVTSVTWTDAVGVSAVGNDLTKTKTQTGWNAGAASVESIPADGYVEFTTAEANTDKMAGLSNGNSGVGYGDIDFAIYLRSTGRVGIYEAGVSKGSNFTGYVPGDVFRVQVAGNTVTYSKNGTVFYTSLGVPTFPLRVDTSLRTLNGTINDVVLEGVDFWQDLVGVSAVGNDLTKTATQTAWNAGATSIKTISGDGYAEFTTAENNRAKMAGLSNGSAGAGYAEIDFAIYLKANGGVAVYENGVAKGGFGTYVAGDVFRVEVTGTTVTYKKNGVTFYTSLAAPTFPLLFDASLRNTGATINDATLN